VRARQGAGPSARLLPITWLSASALLAAALALFGWQGGHYLSPLVLSAVVFGFAFAPAGGSLLAPVRSFGRISYSVFVWHAPVIMAVSQLDIFRRIDQGALRTALMLAAVLPPVLLVSCVSYRLLEQPFLRPKIAAPRRLLTRLAAAYACIVLASAVLFAAEQARSRGNAEPAAGARAQVQPDRVHSAASP
jgi:peptidoglycan/LPS O-acetylase OafA/YrhL